MGNLNLDNPLFASYVFYASILALKTLFMSFWTAKHRIAKQVFAAPEDYVNYGKKAKPAGHTDEDIERVRKAHLNDLENIPLFLITGFLFVLTEPNIVVAKWLFRIFTIGRFSFTIGYLNGITPMRGFGGFLPSMFTNVIMTVMVLISAWGNF